MSASRNYPSLFVRLLRVLLCLNSHWLTAQTKPANKPRSAFDQPFRCQNTAIKQPSTQQVATLFEQQPVATYRIEPKAVKRGRTTVRYPVFKAVGPLHKPFEKQINTLIETCFEEECGQVDLSDSPNSLDLFWYEVVVQNQSFLSIHLTSRVCGNRCHYYSTSLNYDLNAHIRLSNCALLARLGIHDWQFEQEIRARWSTLYVSEMEGQYPSFQTVKQLGQKRSDYEGILFNRYENAPFDGLLQQASILPVIYKQKRYLRLGFYVAGPLQDLIGFADWPLPISK